jgi:Beta-lactamase enzyme family
VRLAHKWGDLPEARHDAGIIYTPRGSYVAVVLTQGAHADEAARAIADVGRASYAAITGG